MRSIRTFAFLMLLAAPASAPAQQTETKPFPAAQPPHHGHAAPSAPSGAWFDTKGLPPPKLAGNLGDHTYRVSANADAQRFFDQGLIYAYGFNHLEALRAFRQAQAIDGACAMCYWGEAYALGPNLNMPMEEAAAPVARQAIAHALARADGATPKEQALIAAMRVRYAEGARADVDRLYADAAVAVARRFPDDPDIAAFAAEAIMLLSPWDYWREGGTIGKGRTNEALELLENVLRTRPAHIGAAHFYIHLVEASDRPQRAETYADRLRGAVPGAGHLVHMPGHIYFRLGRYGDAMAVNRDAVASDESYIADNPGVGGPYSMMYYPHNVHFYLNSALMLGRGPDAVASAEKLARLVQAAAGPAPPPVQPIKQSPYFVAAKFADPAAILAAPQPNAEDPLVVAAWRYARGAALALQGDSGGAAREAEAIDALAKLDYAAFDAALIPARGILEIAGGLVRARAALAAGDLDGARRHAEAAVAAEARLPYMEPPYWYMPASHALGAIHLRRNEPRLALAAFEQALARTPNSVWALQGLRRAQLAQGDAQAAQETQARLDRVAPGVGDLPLERY